MDYTETRSKYFNEELTEDVIGAAAKQNIYLLRIAPNKWESKEKDFLIGNSFMKFSILSDKDFKRASWENGKGFTTELKVAYSSKGKRFEWRLISRAEIVNDGKFSDFQVITLLIFKGTLF